MYDKRVNIYKNFGIFANKIVGTYIKKITKRNENRKFIVLSPYLDEKTIKRETK